MERKRIIKEERAPSPDDRKSVLAIVSDLHCFSEDT
jgi:hypothetical protein